MSEAPPLRAEEILGVLERHRVEYVLVGGYAAQLHGSPERTRDVDVVPATTAENLHRLAAALRQLGARVRTDAVPEGLPFATSAQALVGVEMLNLVTDHGEVDLTFLPSGTQGYPDLIDGAVVLAVGRVQVHVASLADVIRSKQAAGRGKDLRVLPGLRRLAHSLGVDLAVDLGVDAQQSGSQQADPAAAARASAAHTPDHDAEGATAPREAAQELTPQQRIAAARAQAAALRQQRPGATAIWEEISSLLPD